MEKNIPLKKLEKNKRGPKGRKANGSVRKAVTFAFVSWNGLTNRAIQVFRFKHVQKSLTQSQHKRRAKTELDHSAIVRVVICNQPQ
uniref:Uncharacterized protein n=1 Tax=Arundo donax TaxID=35708 RepID=A0A0A9ELA0_ARUDO